MATVLMRLALSALLSAITLIAGFLLAFISTTRMCADTYRFQYSLHDDTAYFGQPPQLCHDISGKVLLPAALSFLVSMWALLRISSKNSTARRQINPSCRSTIATTLLVVTWTCFATFVSIAMARSDSSTVMKGPSVPSPAGYLFNLGGETCGPVVSNFLTKYYMERGFSATCATERGMRMLLLVLTLLLNLAALAATPTSLEVSDAELTPSVIDPDYKKSFEHTVKTSD